jgi:hypothetical protein
VKVQKLESIKQVDNRHIDWREDIEFINMQAHVSPIKDETQERASS